MNQQGGTVTVQITLCDSQFGIRGQNNQLESKMSLVIAVGTILMRQ